MRDILKFQCIFICIIKCECRFHGYFIIRRITSTKIYWISANKSNCKRKAWDLFCVLYKHIYVLIYLYLFIYKLNSSLFFACSRLFNGLLDNFIVYLSKTPKNREKKKYHISLFKFEHFDFELTHVVLFILLSFFFL